MAQDVNLQGRFNEVEQTTPMDEEGILSIPLSPLDLDIEDQELVDNFDDNLEASRNFFTEKYDLFDRRAKNELYRFGRQVLIKEKEKLLKNYESRYMNNVLYEIEGTIKPLSMSRLPDFMVIPGNDSDEADLMAQEVSKAIDTCVKEYDNRRVLGLASQHLPVYFTAVIKARWDPEIDDYVYENIHPDLIDIDQTCTTNDADKMRWISQIVPLTVQRIILMFPKKKREFLDELKKDGLMLTDDPSWTLLATTINIREVWETQYVKKSDTETEKVEGLFWKYKDVILDKMKNPNYDYTGEKRYFAYDGQNKEKRGLTMDEVNSIVLTGQVPEHIEEEQVYHNYHRYPRKPFYFMGYDQWGKIAYDETSRIEQNLQNQSSLDKRGKQLEETLDHRGHNVFSKEAGLTPADIEELDMNDPDEDLVVDGDVNNTHKFIAPERPTPDEFKEMDVIKQNMYDVSHSQAVRGEVQGPVATTNQIAREANFTSADDLVEETINPAAQWMADWAMQFIKLRYTKDHFKWIMGQAGEAVYIKLNRNMIDDGMIVKIKASGTDKLRAQNNAMEMAKMQMTDPYTFFVDMGLSDPEGRTEKLILAKTDPTAYLEKIVKGLNTSEALAQALMNQEQVEQPVPPPSPAMPGVPGQQAAQPPVAPQGQAPQAPTPTNTAATPIAPPTAGPTPGVPGIL